MSPTDQADADRVVSAARAALSAYDLPPITTLRLISSGNNTTFEVSVEPRDGKLTRSTTRYALRIHRPGFRSVTHTRSELEFLQTIGGALRETHVTIPQPIVARHGDLIVEVDVGSRENGGREKRHCDLSSWVYGSVLLPGRGLGPRAVHSLGHALALLHNAAEQFEPTPDFNLPRWDAAGMFTTAASPFRPTLTLEEVLSASDRALFDEIAERTSTLFTRLDRVPGSFGILHADFILGNCQLSRRRNGWTLGVLDFDDCGWGYFCYDLCPLLGNLAGLPGAIPNNPAYPALRSAFLSGYRSARPLPSEWESHLPLLIAARHANHCLWTAGFDQSPTPAEDAAWRMDLARQSLRLAS